MLNQYIARLNNAGLIPIPVTTGLKYNMESPTVVRWVVKGILYVADLYHLHFCFRSIQRIRYLSICTTTDSPHWAEASLRSTISLLFK